MKTIFKKAAIMAASSMMLTTSFAGEKVLNFGIIATESSTNLKTVWTPFLSDMSKKLNIKVKPFFATDYAGVIEGMKLGKVDIAWFGNKSAMEAVDRSNGEVFTQTVAADGSPGYWSILVTHKDSPLSTLQDVLDKRAELTFGNGDPNSTSGFLVPSYHVFAMNKATPKEFKSTLNSNHEENLLSVATKKVDVATNNTESLKRFQTTSPEKAEKIKILWKSPLIPSDPIVWNKVNLDDALKAKIKDFFLTYGTKDEAEKKVLTSLGWAPFIDSNDDQLLPIRQLAIFKKQTNVKNDDSLSKEEKEAISKELELELKTLEEKMAKVKKKAA